MVDNIDQNVFLEDSDPVSKFLNTIPPDWDAAYNHADANLVLKNTVLNLDDSSTFCKCCMLPFPDPDPNIHKGSEKSNYYSLWTGT